VYIIFRIHGVTANHTNGQRLLKSTPAPSCGASAKRGAVPRASALFIYLFIYLFYISRSPQRRSSPTKREDNEWSPSAEPHSDGRPSYSGLRPGSTRIQSATMLLLPQLPCSLQHDTFVLGLSRPEPSLATLRRSVPLRSIPSTPVTTSHDTHGKNSQHVSE